MMFIIPKKILAEAFALRKRLHHAGFHNEFLFVKEALLDLVQTVLNSHFIAYSDCSQFHVNSLSHFPS